MGIIPTLCFALRGESRSAANPVNARFVHGENRAWVFRDPARGHQGYQSGETVRIHIHVGSVEGSADVTWAPGPTLFWADVAAEPRIRKALMWFFYQNPSISGGSHQDQFNDLDPIRKDADRSWDEPASDFFLVRCGKHRRGDVVVYHEPTDEARDWVSSDLFQVPLELKVHVSKLLGTKVSDGSRLTIRRIFA